MGEPQPPRQPELAQDRAILRGVGFRPSPRGWLLHPLRRALWLLLRPFLFQLLDRNRALEARVTRLEERLAALESRRATAATPSPEQSEALLALQRQQAIQRAELTALTHRHAWLADRLEPPPPAAPTAGGA